MSTTERAIDPTERRDNQRFDYSVAVRVTRAGGMVEGSSQDVSAGGMRIELVGQPPKVGERVSVEFNLPMLADPIKAEAEVRWIDRAASSICGLQFMTGLRAREVWAITRLSAG